MRDKHRAVLLRISVPGLCLVFGRRDGGMRAKKFLYLKCASHFRLSVQNFIFPRGRLFWFWVAKCAHQISPPSPRG